MSSYKLHSIYRGLLFALVAWSGPGSQNFGRIRKDNYEHAWILLDNRQYVDIKAGYLIG
jgi:hypothetical protein